MDRLWFRLTLAAGLAALPGVATAAQSAAVPGGTTEKRIYVPADFARFAPKTAYDMLVQVPSFTIRSADTERGLGQASENVLINGQRVADKSGGAIDQLKRASAGAVDQSRSFRPQAWASPACPERSPTSS